MPRPPQSSLPRSRPAAIALLTFLVALSARQEEPTAEWPAVGVEAARAGEATEVAVAGAGDGLVRLAAGDVAADLADDMAAEVAADEAEPALEPALDARDDAAAGYPHPVEFLTVAVAGVPTPLAFMDVSPTGPVNGRTVLLLHGRDLAGDAWAPTIATLSAAGFRVLVPDQVGHGRSGRPAAAPTTATLAAHALVLLDSLGAPRAAVVGEGMGAEVAARLAAADDGRVDRVVFMSPDAWSAAPDRAAEVRRRVRQPVLVLDGPATDAALLEFLGM
jgi:hypothetical protein